jgi:hypothetical protein
MEDVVEVIKVNNQIRLKLLLLRETWAHGEKLL